MFLLWFARFLYWKVTPFPLSTLYSLGENHYAVRNLFSLMRVEWFVFVKWIPLHCRSALYVRSLEWDLWKPKTALPPLFSEEQRLSEKCYLSIKSLDFHFGVGGNSYVSFIIVQQGVQSYACGSLCECQFGFGVNMFPPPLKCSLYVGFWLAY